MGSAKREHGDMLRTGDGPEVSRRQFIRKRHGQELTDSIPVFLPGRRVATVTGS